MRRTLTSDYSDERPRTTAQGDKAVLFYWSANRDESVFADPDRFDITRSPNPHVGFGGAGPHFCLGAHLARREITVMLRELLARIPESARPASPTGCCPASSTASSTCPATSDHQDSGHGMSRIQQMLGAGAR